MGEKYFDWKELSASCGGILFPVEAMETILLLNIKSGKVWLSKQCARLLMGKGEIKAEMTVDEFEQHLQMGGRHIFRQGVQRILDKKVNSASCHAMIQNQYEVVSSMIYLYYIPECDAILGHVSADYDALKEYEQHMQDVITELKHTQMINELTMEGASDYIYQLDLVNNVCTFSSKALEVLPLESPTFSDAMNRVLSFIIPEDRQVFLDSFTPFLTGQSDRHKAEYRVLTKQGEIMWIACKGKGIHDENGRPIMIAGSLLDITERKKDEEKMERMLYYDSLTGLKNRYCFEKEMEAYLGERDITGCFLCISIHKFKLYNDLFGHNFGDKILKDFANMLGLFFSGARGIYRFSGDEFLVHLQEIKKDQILAKLVPFQAVLKKNREIDGRRVYVNAYFAAVAYPEHGRNVEELLKNAHRCMYRMPRNEEGDVVFSSGMVNNEDSKQFFLENELRKDMENQYQNFRVVYQPIVHVEQNNSKWIGAEALLRYSNPEIPNLNQMDLIRTLEYSGLIIPIGRWVIAQAVHECSKWNRMGKSKIVHVNLSAQQVSDVGLVEYIRDLCNEEQLEPSNLVMELTETSMLSNFENATAFCNDLLQLGVRVALDDFGTGYSSFNYLKNLPINQIKIDRSYVQNLQENQYNQTFISFMQQLSRQLDLEMCVEGVETQEEFDVVKNKGISLIQGYYFEKPMESEMISREFLKRTIQA